jgi:antitoxin component YwqK of YwqJK toxin-antitoxin module
MNPRLVPLALVVALGCRGAPPPAEPETILPSLSVQRTWYDEKGEVPKRETPVLVYPDGRVVKHGVEIQWYADGTKRSEREFAHDEPAGTWRTWHRNGAPASEVVLGHRTDLAPMRWWYEDGRLEGEGEGRAGVKEGAWTYWWPDGTKKSEGVYRGGIRHGPWCFWYRDGSPKAEGEYVDGVREGPWRLWDEQGHLVEKEGPPLPDRTAGDDEGVRPTESSST